MFRKMLVFVIGAVLMLPTHIFAKSQEDITVILNGQIVSFQQAPFVQSGTTLVPARAFFEQLGLQVGWDNKTQTMIAKNHQVEMIITVGRKEALVNNQSVELDIAPSIAHDQLFVPLRFIAESVQGEINWNASTRTIRIGTTDEEKLRDAILGHDENRVQALLAAGVYINYTDGGTQQSMLELSINEAPSIAIDLLRAGAETNSRNAQGDYPLHQAIKKYNVELLKLLLDSHANVGVKDTYGRTPLHLARELDEQEAGDVSVHQALQEIITILNPYSIGETGPLLPVKVDEKYGYMDRFGTMVISPQYTYAEPFSEGLAVIGSSEGKGYIDQRGTIVLKPQYYRAGPFVSGVAPVATMNNDRQLVSRYIDKQGNQTFPNTYARTFPFNKDIAVVVGSADQYQLDLKVGMINRVGEEIVPPQYHYNIFTGVPYGEGLFAVTKDRYYWGYIDSKGQVQIPFYFSAAKEFSEGLASVKNTEGLYGYIDHDGKFVIEPKYEFAQEFSEGLAVVKSSLSNGRSAMGVIDKKGSMIISPQFKSIGSFHQGLAPAQMLYGTQKWGYIDTHGDWIIPPIYYQTEGFHDGIARVSIDKSSEMYIDLMGRRIDAPTVQEIMEKQEMSL